MPLFIFNHEICNACTNENKIVAQILICIMQYIAMLIAKEEKLNETIHRHSRVKDIYIFLKKVIIILIFLN